MDMQIDSTRIRTEREKRAWSQEHLAEVTGLSLRTIQRIERQGAGSYETAKSLAAVFEIDVALLRPVVSTPSPARFLRSTRYWSAAASLLLAASLFFVSRGAVAAQVMLDVGLTLDGTELSKSQLITEEGKDAEILLKGQVRVVLQPKINPDGSVAVGMRVYEFSREQYYLVSTPMVFVADNDHAAVELSTSQGAVIRIAITPHKI